MTITERFEYLKSKYYFDEKAATEKVDFIQRYCVHVKGDMAGTPLILDDWQKEEIIYPVFGLKLQRGGARLIRRVYIEIPRKNAKTTLCAGIENALLFNDGEQGAEIYNCAGDDSQAGLLFNLTKSMVLKSPKLSSISKTFQTSITYKDSFIKKITSSSDTKHGFHSHAAIYDELHVAPDRDLYDVLISSFGQRRQPLFIMITTAGYDRESICWEMHDLTQKIIDGTLDNDRHWGVIYAADETDDIYSEDTWRKANPLYDTSPYLREHIKEMAKDAQDTPSFENSFKRLHLNIWTGSETRWLEDALWTECQGAVPDLTGRACIGGLDLASTGDTTSLFLLFPNDDGTFYMKVFFWMPKDIALTKQKKFGINYQTWIRDGWMTETEGNITDYNYIHRLISGYAVRDGEVKYDEDCLAEKYDIRSIAYDRWGADQLVMSLTEDRIKMTPFGQGYASMSSPTKLFEKLVKSKKIIHDGNPVFRWELSNVMIVIDDAENYKISKKRSTEKVDGVVAGVMALGEWMTDTNMGVSMYETGGIKEI